MGKDESLTYIAYFIENISTTTTKHEWRSYLSKSSVLGDKLFSADEDAVKKLARHLYRSYVLSHFSRHTAFTIASKMTDKQIEEYLDAVLELDKKYKIDYGTISTDLDQKSVDSAIKSVTLTRYKSILSNIDPKNSPTLIKAAAAAKRAAAKKTKPVVKSSTKSTTSVKSSKSTASVKSSTSKKPSTTTKKAVVSKKTCSAHNLKELKEMAKEKGMTGYSKLNKEDLCKMLKIK
jgi:hypothetical protein